MDGEITPSEEMTSLKSPKHTININEIRQDEKNKNYLILTGVIPADVGGFYINEIGVLDDENKLFAIGNIAKTYKPLLSEGYAKEIIIEVVIEVANASEITINIYGRYSFSNKRVCKK
ncbi:phage tail protein [Campylobacter ureolyticus]|uniref:Phage tail protein n=1 Tax=Campylobacter ureolyticus TaxID=827 RepID=A0A9Q4KQR5_9BACT|nr:phage tail protein [Campylobacter ureolyticus]MCZ6104069.1 phage tail protein [Campylobacter ureolyticus]MCZ6135491.1 phage tail protein [Campylobacter ureolyticus]MCZ6162447.1 phage tail protein [Campylobacter ureolyticus]MCZ6171372.1 phage tail protein [Campylobacter ureolyticus]MDU4981523.1 phage tail protein [Campylobacter ureolyticus]